MASKIQTETQVAPLEILKQREKLIRLIGAERPLPSRVRLINDHDIPGFGDRANLGLSIGARDKVAGDDDDAVLGQRFGDKPDAAGDIGQAASVVEPSGKRELLAQFLHPLLDQAARRDQQRPLDLPLQHQRPQRQGALDRLAKPTSQKTKDCGKVKQAIAAVAVTALGAGSGAIADAEDLDAVAAAGAELRRLLPQWEAKGLVPNEDIPEDMEGVMVSL